MSMSDLSLERRIELFEFLRSNVLVDVEMGSEYECGREYATCNVSLRMRNPETGDWVEIGGGYGSVHISNT